MEGPLNFDSLRANPRTGLVMLDALGIDNLETRAVRVQLLNARDGPGPSVREALDSFLEMAEPLAVSQWKTVEAHLQNLVVPILDNDYGYNVMSTLRGQYLSADVQYSENFSWANRGLLVYGLSKGLDQEQRHEALTPKVMLQWLSRVVKEDEVDSAYCGSVSSAVPILGQVLFSIWSCRYDSDDKGRKLKFAIADRKLQQIDPVRLCADVFGAPPGPTQYQSLLILLDYFWLRNMCRLEVGTTPFPKLVSSLIDDLHLLNAPSTLSFWVSEKFCSFALECVTKHPTPTAQLTTEDDDAFIVLFNTFLIGHPYACIEAIRRYGHMTDKICHALLPPFVAKYPLVTFQAFLALTTRNVRCVDQLVGQRLVEIVESDLTEAEACGILKGFLDLPESSVTRHQFIELVRSICDSPSPRWVWVRAAVCADIPFNYASTMSQWAEYKRQVARDNWRIDSLAPQAVTTLEQVILSAMDHYLDVRFMSSEKQFDDRIMEIAPVLIRMANTKARGFERVQFLALCCAIYTGNSAVKDLMKVLGIRAVQLYSLAWAMDGMERLWKTNIWTTPRSSCESPERACSQAGSIALLTLDNGSIQSMFTQLEESRPQWKPLVVNARCYSLHVDNIAAHKPTWKQSAAALSNFDFASQPPRGDTVALLGPWKTLANTTLYNSGGLATLCHRLMGYHLTRELLERPEPLPFPTCAHVYLERRLRKLPSAELTLNAPVNAQMFNSGQSIVDSCLKAIS